MTQNKQAGALTIICVYVDVLVMLSVLEKIIIDISISFDYNASLECRGHF